MNVIRKTAGEPRAFYPQDRPSIIGLTANSCGRGSRKVSVKTSGNDHYIDGVPLLEWGKWRDCTYCGALLVLMNTIGICATYEQIMGLSASAFRCAISNNWDLSSTLLQIGISAENNCNRYFGIEPYEVGDDRIRDYRSIRSIDQGIPILICGGRFSAEWSLITGYQPTEDRLIFYGRSYFDDRGAPTQEVFTENQYFLTDRYPGEFPSALFHLYDRQCVPKDPKAAIQTSLQACMAMFQQPAQGVLHFGYDAYEYAAASLQKNECDNIRHHFLSLLDARRAAYIYLAESARSMTGKIQIKLLAASAQYKEMFDLLSDVLPYRELSQGQYDEGPNLALRKRLAKTLLKMSQLERVARHSIGEALDLWEDR